jgi:hypothetical protein
MPGHAWFLQEIRSQFGIPQPKLLLRSGGVMARIGIMTWHIPRRGWWLSRTSWPQSVRWVPSLGPSCDQNQGIAQLLWLSVLLLSVQFFLHDNMRNMDHAMSLLLSPAGGLCERSHSPNGSPVRSCSDVLLWRCWSRLPHVELVASVAAAPLLWPPLTRVTVSTYLSLATRERYVWSSRRTRRICPPRYYFPVGSLSPPVQSPGRLPGMCEGSRLSSEWPGHE